MILYIPDPFEELPQEIRLAIFLSLECKSSILPLIEASPAMLQSYLADKTRILRALLANEFDHQMLQDAMAIILCPKERGFGLYRLEGRAARTMVRFIRRWSRYQMPNPLLDNDMDNLSIQLNELHSWLLILIEDYITKATASSPPREYSCVPQMRTNERHLMFKGAKIARRFDSANLSPQERQKFLHAFLVHELCCMTSNVEFHQQAITGDWHAMPYTRILSRTEYESVKCVDLYFRSLYGAIFVQCDDHGFLPRAEEGRTLRLRTHSPRGSLFYAEQYEPALAWFPTPGVSVNNYAESFSRLGLYRILEFLSYDLANLDGRKALQAKMDLVWKSEHPAKTKKWSNAYKSLMLTTSNTPFDKVYTSIGVDDRDAFQLMVAQQSAWVFFDDERFYPTAPTDKRTKPPKSPKSPKHKRRKLGKKYDRREIVLKCGRRDRPKRCIRKVEGQRIEQSHDV